MAHGSAHTIVPFDLEEEPSQLDPLDAPEPPPMTPIPTARLPSQQRLEPEAWVPGRLIPLPHVADRAADDASDVPVAIALRLRRAGLVTENESVEIVTDAPPPVRERVPPGRSRR
mgnify:CR=1 FL=1